jgi:hypothetical protein
LMQGNVSAASLRICGWSEMGAAQLKIEAMRDVGIVMAEIAGHPWNDARPRIK